MEIFGFEVYHLTIHICIPRDFTEYDTLQRSFFHAHATEWIILNLVLLESWCAKVCCIHLLRSLRLKLDFLTRNFGMEKDVCQMFQ